MKAVWRRTFMTTSKYNNEDNVGGGGGIVSVNAEKHAMPSYEFLCILVLRWSE